MIWRETKHLTSGVSREATARCKGHTLRVVVWESGHIVGSVERIAQPEGRHITVYRQYFNSVLFAQEGLATLVEELR